jgi:hypothetical protein
LVSSNAEISAKEKMLILGKPTDFKLLECLSSVTKNFAFAAKEQSTNLLSSWSKIAMSGI